MLSALVVAAALSAACTLVQGAQLPFMFRPAPDADRVDDYRVIRVDTSAAAHLADFDVWGRNEDGRLDVFVSPAQLALIDSDNLFAYDVVDVDVQRQIDDERARLATAQTSSFAAKDWFTEYHRYDDTKKWFKQLAEKYPHLMTFIPSIGKSHEGRDIFAVKVTSPVGQVDEKKQIWFQGQIHAREWISGATVQYVTHNLLTGYGADEKITALLDAAEFIIVPCMNVDGFEYTWTGQRLWRKNRRVNDGAFAGMGVDLNRNYDEHWADNSGASRSPNAETYKGPRAASEPEVQALTKFFLQHPRIVGAIDFHSFSQLLLRPLGYARKPAEHEADLKRVGDKMRDIIASVHGKTYDSIASYELYPTSGSAADWFYGEQVTQAFGHHVYSYTIELRPKNSFGGQGFILPPDQIIPTGEEILPAVLYFAQSVLDKPLS